MEFPAEYVSRTNEANSKSTTVFVGIVVNGRLDIDLLRLKAQELVSQWPLLGGTVLTKTSPYTLAKGSHCDFKARTVDVDVSNYIPFDFSVNTADLSSNMPWVSTEPSGVDSIIHFDTISTSELPPKANFTLRVTVLNDSTLLGFRMPHYLADAQSMFDVVKAYCDLIAGRQLPMLVTPPDVEMPLSQLTNIDPQAPSSILSIECLEKVKICAADEVHSLGLWNAIRTAFGVLFAHLAQGLLQSTDFSERYIYLPKDLVCRLQVECQEELERTGLADVKLSKTDVIAAWYLKTAFRNVAGDDGPFDAMHTMNHRFSCDPPKPGSTYLKNSQYAMAIRWSSFKNFQSTSLAQVALAFRMAVMQNKQPSVIKTFHEFYEKHADSILSFGPEGNRIGFLSIYSSWSTFPFYDLDFSGALEKFDVPATSEAGNVAFVHPTIYGPRGINIRPVTIVLKDRNGGFWLKSDLLRSAWKGLIKHE
ncbi:hypothetical protein BP5796_12352 [Coleophoma crateriformis]|uniref:Transferase family protein n=1 Tax=Coleophoma crateriformis TaxID=565419 RepID=A0A3D8Q9A3_9HELO|nr:hypothetical protein BP5796_12352 [Coleophoma crateriformis]